MRRKDRLVENQAEIDAMIAGCEIVRLALSVNDEPYLVPLSFGYDGDAIYVHTARKGKKIEYFEANDRVCFEFERDVRFIRGNGDACEATFSYESVIGYGRISEIKTLDEKSYALRQIACHYMAAPSDFTESATSKVRVWKIDVDSMTGKRSPQKETG
jgi:nitroimidazol reductase NimA-like FMN-containing flavoprotein (pyridoxamine 5'-phosphate oxidase superfamily)